MKCVRAADQRTQRGAAENFTGVAWQQTFAIGETTEPLHVVRVTFEPGARTVWHHHSLGQILVATAGIGRFQLLGGPLMQLHPGDSVTIAPGETHWHGSAPDQLFIHLSIQAADAQGIQATWLQPVSENEYSQNPDL